MTTTIFSSTHHKVTEGKNLAIMFRYARGRGVKSITVEGKDWAVCRVTTTYMDGWYAVTNFASYNHACEWATARSKLGRSSWFHGCKVILKD